MTEQIPAPADHKTESTVVPIYVINGILERLRKVEDLLSSINTTLANNNEQISANNNDMIKLIINVKILDDKLGIKIDCLEKYLSTKIDCLEKYLSTKIDCLEKYLSTKIDCFENRLK